MKATIEYCRLSRTYFFFPEPANRGHAVTATSKAEIERRARKFGATEFEHVTRNPVRDLQQFARLDRETAKETVKAFYPDSRHGFTASAPTPSASGSTPDEKAAARSAAAKKAWETIRAKKQMSARRVNVRRSVNR